MDFSVGKNISPVTEIEAKNIINSAEGFELSRDFQSILQTLYPVWQDIETDPDFSSYSSYLQAKFYRAAGYFLVFYGQSQALPNLMARGTKILSKAVNLFKSLSDTTCMREAQIIYGVSFAVRGNFSEAEKILRQCENFYLYDKSHYNFLLIQVNRLFTLHQTRNFASAKAIIEKHRTTIESSADDKLKCQFFNQAGIIYRNLNSFALAEKSFQKAIESAKYVHSPRFLSIIVNNLAMLFKDEKQFDEARDYVDKALKIVQSLDDYDLLGHFSDTKAQICFETVNYEEALLIINKSIFYFRSGNDYVGRLAALWLKVKILYKSDRCAEAESEFADLIKLAAEKCSQKILNYYRQEFETFRTREIRRFQDSTEIHKVMVGDLPTPANANETEYFFFPSSVANLTFAVNLELIVTTSRERLAVGDFAVFLSDGKFFCGQVIRKDGWYLKEILTLKDLPIEWLKNIRKVTTYQCLSDFTD